MAVGGSTWDTAGTLDVEGGTFDVADAVEDGDVLFEVGWWKFTPTTEAKVALDSNVFVVLYTGADEPSKEQVGPIDLLPSGNGIYWLHPGVEYHVQVGRLESGPFVTTYTVTRTDTRLVHSPWISSLRDQEQQIIVSEGDDGTANPTGFQPEDIAGWSPLVIDSANPPGRQGNYIAQEELGGFPVSGAASCVMQHADWGDHDGLGFWDGVCPPLVNGFAEIAPNSPPRRMLDAVDTEEPASDTAQALSYLASRAIRYLPVRDNLGPQGVLPFPSSTEDGYTGAIGIEWETPYVELVGVEAKGDRPGDSENTVNFAAALRDFIQPSHDGVEWGPWHKGLPGGPAPGETKTYVTFDELDWVPVPDVVDGDDGWGAAVPYDEVNGLPPDDVAILWVTDDPGNPGEIVTDGVIGLRFTLRSPRYRWIYESDTTVIPPRRIFGRSDGLTHGARRTLGGGNTRQAGNRTLGGIL